LHLYCRLSELTPRVSSRDNKKAENTTYQEDSVDAASIGKWIVVAGLGLVVAGGAVWLLAKTGVPLGRLPGDIHVQGERSSFHFPIVTCIVVSIVLTIILNIVARFWGK